MTRQQLNKRVLFLADREEDIKIIRRAKKNARLYIPRRNRTRSGVDFVFCRIYGTLKQIAKLLNEKPETIAEIIKGDRYGLSKLQYTK